MITEPIRSLQTKLNVPVEMVWKALTTPEIVIQYFFGALQQSTFKVGDPITWVGEFMNRKYQDKGEILACEKYKTLEFTYLSSWSGKTDIPENYLWVKYELFPEQEGTQLKISCSGYDEKGADHFLENWGRIVQGLKKTIEN